MEMITDIPAGEVEQVVPAPGGDSRKNIVAREPPFTPAQQRIFDRALAKQKGKLRRELDGMRRDLLETVALTGQLLKRCSDRISRQDATAITTGLREIEREYRQRRGGR